MKAGFELFDHTADMGIRIWAPTMTGLVVPATAGLYAVIGESDVGVLQTRGLPEKESWNLKGADAAGLLRDYLTEVLLLFESEHRVARVESVAAFDNLRLAVNIESRDLDLERSILLREVKAVTYHELAIRAIEGGFEARVIVDI